MPVTIPISCEVLRPDTVVPALQDMTFPAYRKFLALQPAPRHPEQGDKRVVQPIGLVAWQGRTPVGLAIAEQPFDAPEKVELLSLFVVADARNGGIGTRLVGTLESHLSALGVRSMHAVYMTGKPGIPALERVFEKCGWTAPETRAISVRFTPEEALRTPWFGRVTLPASEFEIVSWCDVADAEKAEIVRTHQESPWIAKGLEPWRHDFYGYDRLSSVGLRYRGRIVGWVINHEMGPGNVRFTCSFMHPELSRRGRIFPLYTESLTRLRDAGCQMCTLVTPMHYREMALFLKRRCVPWVRHVSESRGVSKDLAAASAGRQGS
ncbi:MAG TPA: GNAT family N-acetyltransferase [Vicinamibacterales bacterium]